MEQSGTWFKKNYNVTPATSFTVTKDIEGSDLKTAWFNSRFYRVNMLWEHNTLRIRDIHLFDEAFPSIYETQPVTSNECIFYTLPIIDGYIWSRRNQIAGLRIKAMVDGKEVPVEGGEPKFTNTQGTLHISWPLTTVDGSLEMEMTEGTLKMNLISKAKLDWYFDLNIAATAAAKLPFQNINATNVECKFENTSYKLKAVKGTFSKPDNGAVLRLKPLMNSIILNTADTK